MSYTGRQTVEKLSKFWELLDLLVKKMVRRRFADIWEGFDGIYKKIDLFMKTGQKESKELK